MSRGWEMLEYRNVDEKYRFNYVPEAFFLKYENLLFSNIPEPLTLFLAFIIYCIIYLDVACFLFFSYKICVHWNCDVLPKIAGCEFIKGFVRNDDYNINDKSHFRRRSRAVYFPRAN